MVKPTVQPEDKKGGNVPTFKKYWKKSGLQNASSMLKWDVLGDHELILSL